jgi:K+-sensing histidine kinase KdpD
MADLPDDAVMRQLVHDLRGPLTIIDGFAMLLERDDGTLGADKRAEFAQRIRAAATEMRAVIDGAVG